MLHHILNDFIPMVILILGTLLVPQIHNACSMLICFPPIFNINGLPFSVSHSSYLGNFQVNLLIMAQCFSGRYILNKQVSEFNTKGGRLNLVAHDIPEEIR